MSDDSEQQKQPDSITVIVKINGDSCVLTEELDMELIDAFAVSNFGGDKPTAIASLHGCMLVVVAEAALKGRPNPQIARASEEGGKL